ncbi:hypothetical protein ACP70R_036294 [Stipagrostis hirtigluma subsp. patula]
MSPFLRKLFKEWDGRKLARGLFHHDIDSCESKVLPGEHNFVATLIEGRDQEKRQMEFGMNQVFQPFDSGKLVQRSVSPIGYCHVLLAPRIQDCLPQTIDQESFLLAMYTAREARNPFFRVGYNSLGSFAIVNHLHFQAYYLKSQYPVEKAPTEKLTTYQIT